MEQSKPSEPKSKPRVQIILGPIDPPLDVPVFVTVETCGVHRQSDPGLEDGDDQVPPRE